MARFWELNEDDAPPLPPLDPNDPWLAAPGVPYVPDTAPASTAHIGSVEYLMDNLQPVLDQRAAAELLPWQLTDPWAAFQREYRAKEIQSANAEYLARGTSGAVPGILPIGGVDPWTVAPGVRPEHR